MLRVDYWCEAEEHPVAPSVSQLSAFACGPTFACSLTRLGSFPLPGPIWCTRRSSRRIVPRMEAQGYLVQYSEFDGPHNVRKGGLNQEGCPEGSRDCDCCSRLGGCRVEGERSCLPRGRLSLPTARWLPPGLSSLHCPA